MKSLFFVDAALSILNSLMAGVMVHISTVASCIFIVSAVSFSVAAYIELKKEEKR